MTTLDVLLLLLRAGIASAAASAIAMMVRRPLRTMFGADVAYAAWSIVPLATIAACLPTYNAMPALPDVATVVFRAPVDALARSAGSRATFDAMDALLAFWTFGVIALVFVFARRQRDFVRALGALVERDGVSIAATSAGLPAVIGVVRPLIVLPADHATRYTPDERRLLVAHECSHIARGDLLANAFATAMRCVLWFNPLLHIAMPRFRHDQELACDARVIARHPQLRRAYGEAMLKTQLAAQSAPLACLAGFGHPLKERIAMLMRPKPSTRRARTGAILVAVLSLAAACGAWGSQKAASAAPTLTGDMVRADIALSINEGPADPIVLVSRFGEPIMVKTHYDDHAVELEGTITPAEGGLLQFEYTLREDGEDLGKSAIKLTPGKAGMILRGGDRIDGKLHGAKFDIVLTTAGDAN